MSEKDSKEEILKAFKLFDDDDTGRISFSNLKRVTDEESVNLSNSKKTMVRGLPAKELSTFST